jgi:hypothetical protein
VAWRLPGATGYRVWCLVWLMALYELSLSWDSSKRVLINFPFRPPSAFLFRPTTSILVSLPFTSSPQALSLHPVHTRYCPSAQFPFFPSVLFFFFFFFSMAFRRLSSGTSHSTSYSYSNAAASASLSGSSLRNEQSSPTSTQSPITAPSPTMRKRQRTLDMHPGNSAPADPHPPPGAPPAVGDDAFINDHDAVDSAGDDDEEEDKPKSDKKAGRRKIKIEFIQDKSRRHITFSKRKAGMSSISKNHVLPFSHAYLQES